MIWNLNSVYKVILEMVVGMSGWAVKRWLAIASELPPTIKNLGTDCFGTQPQSVTLFLD